MQVNSRTKLVQDYHGMAAALAGGLIKADQQGLVANNFVTVNVNASKNAVIGSPPLPWLSTVTLPSAEQKVQIV